MTEKQEQICEKCGYEEWEHPIMHKACKKFVLKNHSQPEGRRRRYKHTRAAQNQEKGCGKWFYSKKEGMFKCGREGSFGIIELCPTCQEKEK